MLSRAGPKRGLRTLELPEWHGWDARQEWRRSARFIESKLVQPVGVGQGRPIRVAPFQRKILRVVYDAYATFISIAAGNGKTTLMAAVGLERICRGDDYVEVDVLATKEEQAQRLIERAVQIVEVSPALAANEGELFDVYGTNSLLKYRLTGSTVRAHPAKLSAVQGLNFNLALIDEIGEVPPELVTTMLARLGKRPEQRVVGFGTPGFGPDNMLERIRQMAHQGELPAGVRFIEFAADPGCDIYDERQWAKANPAVEAGFLDPATLGVKAALMPEHEFRAYHLGQPVATSGPWLPAGSWDGCVDAEAPGDGQPVVLAVWGDYRRRISVCGATLDGSVFFGWRADQPSDGELEAVLVRAAEQWDVRELTHKPHLRLNLMGRLRDAGLPVEPWPADKATDVESTAALYQAISFREVAHDHHPLLAQQVALLTAQVDRQGNPRLTEADEVDVSAALAVRAAWWRARVAAEQGVEIHIY
jgi:phage terminase large subunit-like protein